MTGYLVVEGPYDLAFFLAILKRLWGAEEVKKLTELPQALRGLIPKTFPANKSGDFSLGVGVPTFCRIAPRPESAERAETWVVVHVAVGDGALPSRLEQTLNEVDRDTFDAIGLVLDADSSKTPPERFDALAKALKKRKLKYPSGLDKVEPGTPRIGVFVLPDNSSQGTLENLLIACGERSYPDLMSGARQYVEGMKPHVQKLSKNEQEELLTKAAGTNKATIASVATLIKPGRALQNSIRDNAWISPDTLALPALQPTLTFLRDLLGLP